MKSMDAEQGASPYRVWPAEPASFSTRRMSPLRHNIDEHPLFQLSALQALAHELMPTGQCRFQRAVRNGERNLGNYHVAAIIAGKVDPLGKAGQAKNDASLIRLDGLLMPAQNLLLAVISLHQNTSFKDAIDSLVNLEHLAARREQHQTALHTIQDARELRLHAGVADVLHEALHRARREEHHLGRAIRGAGSTTGGR